MPQSCVYIRNQKKYSFSLPRHVKALVSLVLLITPSCTCCRLFVLVLFFLMASQVYLHSSGFSLQLICLNSYQENPVYWQQHLEGRHSHSGAQPAVFCAEKNTIPGA